MLEETIEIKNSIKHLYSILKTCPDEPKLAHELAVYLQSFLRMKTKNPLPTTEVMTLIKEHKPICFRELRKMSGNNMMLEILTNLSTDIDTANENLEKIMNQES